MKSYTWVSNVDRDRDFLLVKCLLTVLERSILLSYYTYYSIRLQYYYLKAIIHLDLEVMLNALQFFYYSAQVR